MLVLRHRAGSGEYIQIGDNIRVYLIDVKGDTGGIGVDAPTDIKIYRNELLDTINENNDKSIPTTREPLA